MSCRLDKFLTMAGAGTRSQVKEFLKKGLVTVDRVTEKRGERKVTGEETVLLGGKRMYGEEYCYLMLYKPEGVVTAVTDKREKTVLDLIDHPRKKELFPVGRLDKDTEGLLLLTNDGALAHELLSPKKHVDKRYFARVDGMMTEREVQAFLGGLDIGDEKPALPAALTILSAGDVSEVEVVIQEGRYHQVKRMFEAVGSRVRYLKRLSMGSLVLDETLEKGDFRRLTDTEISALRRQDEI